MMIGGRADGLNRRAAGWRIGALAHYDLLALCALALCGMLAGCGGAAQHGGAFAYAHPAMRQVLAFDQWVIGCHSQHQCHALVPITLDGQDTTDNPYYMIISYTDQISDAQSVMMMRGGTMVDSLSPLIAHQFQEDLLSGRPGGAIIVGGEDTIYRIPRAGYRDVVRTLAAWRRMPRLAHQAQLVVTPHAATPIDAASLPRTPALPEDACNADETPIPAEAWRGPGGAILWRIGCDGDGANLRSHWFHAANADSPPARIQFRGVSGQTEAYNASFDAAHSIIRMTHYFGGHTAMRRDDCGVERAFLWAQDGVTLIEERSMPTCGTGITPDGWISLYQAVIMGSGRQQL